MARRARPSGRFFWWSALTALGVYVVADRVKARGGVPVPAGRTTRTVTRQP